eukprot:Gregarina_sp_Pseudo_9__2590@NODE_2853_length_850_cov_3_161529_g2611_i0_p1_GENE_NODE_2853_length_850_cov_3_161529_g2611_i0NODE_2853_length_850_cov_3_161529_g2611_i0_p1_ORF_typecomplete_len267_score67_89Pkinase_Tyr/PF07714_17/0_015Pkinase/PF00069_25/0_22_NODE_2853_length_850_cov_3_161529_g2611_i049756
MEAIKSCLQTDPQDRPSFEQLGWALGLGRECGCHAVHTETRLYEAFRRRWSFLRQLMSDAASRAAPSPYVPNWLTSLYPHASRPSVLTKSDALQRDVGAVDSVLMQPVGSVWHEVFACVERAYNELPHQDQAELETLESLVHLQPGQLLLETQLSETPSLAQETASPINTALRSALDCYVRVAFDSLRALGTQDRSDGYWDKVSNQWLAATSTSCSERDVSMPEDGTEIVDLKAV